MFHGKSVHVIDSKGRLSIPSRFREVLRNQYSDVLFVANKVECLVAYPQEEWRKIENKFQNTPLLPPAIQRFRRFFMASAVQCRLDSHGRILLPADLRDEVGIGKEVVLLGIGNNFEIWKKAALEEEFKEVKENFEEYFSLAAKYPG